MTIEGMVVVITGASSGLGKATARHLSARGAMVVLGARRVDRLEALAKELNAKGGKALVMATDVTDAKQVQHLVDAAVKTYGRIDVIINNAGLMPQSTRSCRTPSAIRTSPGASASSTRAPRYDPTHSRAQSSLR